MAKDLWVVFERCVRRVDPNTRARFAIDVYAHSLSTDKARELLGSQATTPNKSRVKRTLHEVLTSETTRGTKLYIDIDITRPNIMIEPTPAEVLQATTSVRQQADVLVEALRQHVPGDVAISYVIATRHRRKKLSFRIFIQGLYVSKYWDIPSLLKELLPAESDREHWDIVPYSKTEQLLACINCYKTQDDTYEVSNRLIMERDDDDPLKYTAQWYDESWHRLDIGHIHQEVGSIMSLAVPADIEEANEVISVNVLSTCVPRHDVIYVQAILSILDVSWYGRGSYDKWLKVGMALANASRLDQYANQTEQAYLQAWIDFSCRATEYAREAHHVCTAKWRTFNTTSYNSAHQVTLGTLCAAAKEIDASRYKVATDAMKDRLRMVVSTRTSEESSNANDEDVRKAVEHFIHARLVERWPERFATLCRDSFSIVRVVSGPLVKMTTARKDQDAICTILEFCDTTSNISGKIYPDYSVSVDGDTGKLVGEMAPGLDIGELCRLHKDIDNRVRFNYSRDTATDLATLRGTGENDSTSITIDRPYTGDPCARVSVRGASSTLTVDKTRWLLKELVAHAARHAKTVLGPQAGTMFNNCTFTNIFNITMDSEAQDSKHDDEAIARLLINARPDIVDRIRLVPDIKSNNCNGVYYCDPVNNVWQQRANIVLERILLQALDGISSQLTAADIRHVKSRRGRGDILYAVAAERVDEYLERKLDANLDVFAVENGVFDMTTRTFRATKLDDYVKLHAAWSYNPEVAVRHRANVERFLEQILPIPEERKVLLTYIASLMSGRRTIKKFVVFTDNRVGNNGKSTLASLFKHFFDAYMVKETKFVCRGSIAQDRNSHEAAIEEMRGKRLIAAEELKHTMSLDEGMLKNLTGGAANVVEGRMFHKGDRFQFVWQAGFMLIFNEGDCPKFDTGDQAFVERMMVVPFRSKFVSKPEYERLQAQGDMPEFTYPVDPDIVQQFPEWRSALADVLMEHHDKSVMDIIPRSMCEWKQDITADRNPVASWLERTVVVTGNRDDYLLLKDLVSIAPADVASGGMNVGQNIKAYFATFDTVRYKNKGDKVMEDGQWKCKPNVFRGVKLS